ncbi:MULTISPECIES: NmrA family NAD(P)-binding protein [Rhizobium]|uniref:NmrA family NAD(P)-binding protein n=1 Tax=Rhizobium changzhiense TaxID=2692317 RepID=A0A7Z0UGK5_9HYPH|nr:MULTISPECIES: NmrA family NAD(P)-binding protein [Rhizobium]MCV9946255.1 NmrA family NAD(P)-binding protein [Rhizobium sp. BT-175]MCW0020400.1 NmrA family NAD(P)-binding protein [Rhizobium sp. BT-226]NZD65405.1 NmrA family NAD(P)-binding protein [Rhizobium changzhiense]
MYVVLGANGRAGGEVARALIELGEAVRVVLRCKEQGEKWTALGAEVAVASIEDAEAMAEALKGASGAFLLNPPPVSDDPYARTEELGAALTDAARRARLPKAVVLSSIGAQHVSGTGVIATLNRFEALLDGVAPATAFLRSGYFIETWGEVAEAVMSQSMLPTFLEPSQRIPMVSTIDVGRVAAIVLREEWTGKRVVELSGPEDWSAGDVASAFAEVLGRPVVPVLVPPERRTALLAEEGLSPEVASALLGMYEGIANGLFMHQNDSERRRGTISLTTAIERIAATVEPARGGRI